MNCEHHDYTMVEEYIRNLQWSPDATDHERSLVAGNIRGFYENVRKLASFVDPNAGYKTAYWEIADALGIGAMAMSPAQGHVSVVMPKLRELLTRELPAPAPSNEAAQELTYGDLTNEAQRIAVNLRKNGHYLASTIMQELARRLPAPAPSSAGEGDALVVDQSWSVLAEHSGCGYGTQVDQITVRVNRGDKVVLVPASAFAQKQAAPTPGNHRNGESVGFRYRVCPRELRDRPWTPPGIVAEWGKPTPPDNDTIEYQPLCTPKPEAGAVGADRVMQMACDMGCGTEDGNYHFTEEELQAFAAALARSEGEPT